MKIYEWLEVDIETGDILNEVSYEYGGPVAMCGGGSTPAPPAPDPTEQALNTEQLSLLREQRSYQKEMEPFQLEAMGYYRDENGKIQKSTTRTAEQVLSEKNLALLGYSPKGEKLTEEQMQAVMTPAELDEYKITQLSRQRQLDALEGKLAVSPALEAELTTEETQAKELLARKLGPNWMLSTPGQQALTNLRQKASLLREEARRGQITAGEGILSSRMNQDQIRQQANSNTANLFMGNTNNRINQMTGYGNNMISSLPAYQSMAKAMSDERTSNYNAAMNGYMSNQSAKTGLISGLTGMAGTVGAGTAIAIGIAA